MGTQSKRATDGWPHCRWCGGKIGRYRDLWLHRLLVDDERCEQVRPRTEGDVAMPIVPVERLVRKAVRFG